MAKSRTMKLLAVHLSALFLASAIGSSAFAQTLARSPSAAPSPSSSVSSDAAQMAVLVKKIDEQNTKIDMLSQQILKLEQQLAGSRPGVMIGEGAPSPPPTSSVTTSASSPLASPSPSPSPGNGTSHTVARGETLTSIAKMHNVSVTELQKYNHIDNPLKLQAGQTIMIPASPAPSPSSSGE